MKIVNVRKFIRAILLVLFVIGLLSLIIIKSTFSHKDTTYKTVYVSNGDTLWSIAANAQKNNEYYAGKDVRYIIDDLMETNNLKSSTLSVNQSLSIPVV